MLSCTKRATAFSPAHGKLSKLAQSATSDSRPSGESDRLVNAIRRAPFWRAWRAASSTATVWPECEKAITTSPRRNSAADINISWAPSKTEARTPMRRNWWAASRAT